ncbi:MAG: hypothetical protein PHV30_09130 [Candidatus Margulisbacteria bacterium]|nr:hypothetical protein [Candidatus Margulisiibacteriota bacterium]
MPDKMDEILDLLRVQKSEVDRLVKIEKAREIEGDLGLESGNQDDSQMFSVRTGVRDITGEYEGVLTKTRFSSFEDVEKMVEPFVQKFYKSLSIQHYYGPCSVFVSLQYLQDNEGRYPEELEGYEVYPELFEFRGKTGYEIFPDIDGVRTRSILTARLAAEGGKSRVEEIHSKGGQVHGMSHLENHVRPPDLEFTGYEKKKLVEKPTKIKAVVDAVTEDV